MFELDFSKKKSHKKFKFFDDDFKSAVVLSEIEYIYFTHWKEHCLECSAPDCFKSCQLYSKRADMMCERFYNGIYPNRKFSGLLKYGADIHFKRWGKLEANIDSMPVSPEFIIKKTNKD